MRTPTLTAIALFSFGVSACAHGSPTIEHFARAPDEATQTCGRVCDERLGIDPWSWHRIDDCADTHDANGRAGVACIREAEWDVFERGRRLEVVLAPEDFTGCWEVCGTAIRAHESDELVRCRDTFTEQGRRAAVCAIEWDRPSRGL